MNKYVKLKNDSDAFESKRDDAFKQLTIISANTTIEFGIGLNGTSRYTTTIISYSHIENIIADLYYINKELKERLKSFESTRFVFVEKQFKKK